MPIQTTKITRNKKTVARIGKLIPMANSIGGPGARLAQDCIRKVDCIEYPELGMEAIRRIEVVNFPAFIVIDDKGNDFFQELKLG